MRSILRIGLVVAGIAMVLATIARVQTWGSERALWMEAIRHSPEKPRPWINLGVVYARDHADALAADMFRIAIVAADRPARAREHSARAGDVARLNLALQRASQGQYAEALSWTAGIYPRSTPSLVTHLEQQWRDALIHAPSARF